MSEKRQLSPREILELKREARRDYNIATFGTNTPNVSAKRDLAAANAAADIVDRQQRAGVPESMMGEIGADRSGRIIDITGKNKQEKWWAEDRLDTIRELQGFKSFGDKSAFEVKNALRKLRGLEPLQAPLPANQQFLVDLEKSASFGNSSALAGPQGQARAFEAGIRAGYTPEQVRKFISDTAAKITGPADQQKEKEKFISDFANAGKGAVPQPVGMLTPVERTTANLDRSFFGGLTKNTPTPAPAPAPAPVTPPPVPVTPPAPVPVTPPPATPPVNPQNMTTAEGVLAAGMRGSLGGIPTPVLRDAMTTGQELLKPMFETSNFLNAASQLDFILGKNRKK
jgi:hypothetical protein